LLAHYRAGAIDNNTIVLSA